MDTNNLLNTGSYATAFELVGQVSAASSDLSGIPYPAGSQVGDIAIAIQVDHDNGSTTTLGTTSPGGITGFSTLAVDSDGFGSDDMDFSFLYKILTSTDLSTGIPSGSPSGGDSYLDCLYVLTKNSPVNTATLTYANAVAYNIEAGSTQLSLTSTSSANTGKLALIVGGYIGINTTAPTLTPVPNLTDSGLSVTGSTTGNYGRLLFATTLESPTSAVTFTEADSESHYHAIGLAVLEIT